LNAVILGSIVFVCIFSGALLGMFFRTRLSDHHLNPDTKDVVKVAIAVVATMGALVVSLLISSAKTAYDARSNEVLQVAADVVMLDRVLAYYGPETTGARALLSASVAAAIERVWPNNDARPLELEPRMSPINRLFDKIVELEPQTNSQRALQAEAVRMAQDLGRIRFLLDITEYPIPLPFLAILVSWMTVIFLSFGIFAPNNSVAVGSFFICSLSIAGAIFLIVDLDQPFNGLMQVSSVPLRQALARLGL
jgi:hypothetical protein